MTTPRRLPAHLLDAASAPYRPAGLFAHRFARGKLGSDPAFATLLHEPWIGPGARVLDLGCGQALLASLLRAAGRDARVDGIELMPRDVERARRALGPHVHIRCGDIRTEPFTPSDVVVVLDVLHYLDRAAQSDVLRRIRAALAPGGMLLLRVGDADGGLRFRISQWVDHVVTVTRGHRLGTMWCRPLDDWSAELEALGFDVERRPLSQGTPFANVLLVARLTPQEPGPAGGRGATPA